MTENGRTYAPSVRVLGFGSARQGPKSLVLLAEALRQAEAAGADVTLADVRALGGGGAANVLNSLHHATRALNGLTMPTTVIASGGAIRDGEVTDETVHLRRPVADLVERY